MPRRPALVPRPVEHIADALAVEPVGMGDDDTFRSRTLWLPSQARGVFGGQVLAQALAAAGRTVSDELSLHSVHSYFLAAGNPRAPIEYRVRRLRDGGRYAARVTIALQKGNTIFIASSSYHRGEPDQPSFQLDLIAPWAAPPGSHTTHSDATWAAELGPAAGAHPSSPAPGHPAAAAAAAVVPGYSTESAQWMSSLLPPETAPPTTARFDQLLRRPDLPDVVRLAVQGQLLDREASPIDMRDADPSLWDENGLARPGTRQAFWMRARHTVHSNGEQLADGNKLALAYASDFNLLATNAKALGIPIPGMIATIDHTVWFYRTDFDAHQWFLYVMQTQAASNGRGVVSGRVYRRDGALIAVTVRSLRLRSFVGFLLTLFSLARPRKACSAPARESPEIPSRPANSRTPVYAACFSRANRHHWLGTTRDGLTPVCSCTLSLFLCSHTTP